MHKRLPVKLLLFAFVTLACASQALADPQFGKYGGIVREVYPGDDFKAIIAQMQPGDELVFHEGVYAESYYRSTYGYNTLIYLDRSGTPEKPLVFRGYGKGEARPIFLYDVPQANLCEVRGNNIEFHYMEFQPITGGARGIRIVGGPASAPRSNIHIENCVFRGSVANSIDANDGNSVYDGIRVLNNKFIGVRSTALYIGNQNGSTSVHGFVCHGNYLDATEVNNPGIVGYGMELKLNVKGAVVTRNIFVGTQGPGIMLYGATDQFPENANLVAENIMAGSRNSPGILVGAGPSVVMNNMVLGCPGGGIRAYDYGSRGLLHNIAILKNTAAANDQFDFRQSGVSYEPQNVVFADNIAISKTGVPGFSGVPADAPGNTEVGSDAELEALIEVLKADIPSDPDSMKKVLPHLNKLKHGPFTMAEVKYLVGKVSQKLE